MLGGSFRLVEPLKRSVVALVEAPVLGHGNPQLVERVERDAEGPNRPLEHGGIGLVEDVAPFFEQAAGFGGLDAAALGQIDVGPPGEPVFLVPGALSVTQQNDAMHEMSPVYAGLRARMAARPAYAALAPSSSSMRSS
jgi:hypothetical protein